MANRLTIKIGGKDEDVDASSFLTVVSETIRLLQDLDAEMTGGSPSVNWVLSGASKNSPALFQFEGRSKRGRDRVEVTGEFVASMIALEAGANRPRYFTDSMLDRAKRISSPVGSKLSSLAYFEDASLHVASVTLRTAANADRFHLSERYTEYGELEGSLGQLTAHDEQYEFCIYDSLTNRAIKCEFDPADFDRVREAMRRKVLVSGLITYRRKDHTAVGVKVDSWGVTRPSVSIEELHAARIDLTRGRTSEDVVRTLRAFNA